MEVSLRFDCPSASLRLVMLSKRTHNVLWPSLVLAVIIHLSFTQLVGRLGQERTAAKPLTTQFVKRQPRLTKPLEMKKKPRPKRRRLQRKMVSVTAKVNRQEVTSSIPSIQVLGSLARPDDQMRRSVGLATEALEPQAMAQAIQGTKESQHTLDMSLEMLDMDALDTGRYQAMVVVDPTDPRNIRGYLHLVLIHMATIAQMAGTNAVHIDAGIKKLLEALNEYTDIEADIRAMDDFSSPETLQTPWIYVIFGGDFELDNYEYQAVGAYLTAGGFLFCDEGIGLLGGSYIKAMRAFKKMYRKSLATQGLHYGTDWAFERLPNHHPLYHCYYDFDGPPMGYWWHSMQSFSIYRTDPLQAVVLDDRVLGIITRRSYVAAWYGKGWVLGDPNDVSQVGPQRRAQQFGINTIIFALTQEGSITRRLMDTVK